MYEIAEFITGYTLLKSWSVHGYPRLSRGLNSLDALQISMGLQSQFGARIVDSKEFRRHVTTINALADYIQPE